MVKKITVYEFTVLDKRNGKRMHVLRKASQEAIRLLGGFPLSETAERVDQSRLDENGCLLPP